MEESDINIHKYALRSKGEPEEQSTSPLNKKIKKVSTKSKLKIKVDETKPKRVINLEKNEDGQIVKVETKKVKKN